MSPKVYAVYKGESLICIGTVQECAQHLGVLPKTVYYYKSSSYKKRVAIRKNARNYLTVIALEED
ncbi:hypothetical protein P4493_22305 [Bacillus thuringiensis]|uniref:Uncharacterized protein n=4 Tax=Bacillus cereus group TaxID=86661 RepID=A0AAQ2KTV5_BACTU|nr:MULTISPECIES: hypothetical protein [Bacillus]AZJ19590.1 hypothetical protein CT694_07710 [Bacillus wiedmannii bv. thuringiensis]EAO53648.1 Phage protein [Bacillus thuringiensis serovar israelensis ATCC 35646]MCU5404639.1 hypothetical protein [Bacillus cereus]AFQ27221.1 hypothetical protein BTF1_15230 [Bacillus thuringiensis HD-789]AJH06944.1 hypothetical protein AS86_463 [Bacillus thuringiensis HD1002]